MLVLRTGLAQEEFGSTIDLTCRPTVPDIDLTQAGFVQWIRVGDADIHHKLKIQCGKAMLWHPTQRHEPHIAAPTLTCGDRPVTHD